MSKTNLICHLQRLRKIVLRLARQTDNYIRRKIKIGDYRPEFVNNAQKFFPRVMAVHPLQNIVAARLKTKMDVRRKFRIFKQLHKTVRKTDT